MVVTECNGVLNNLSFFLDCGKSGIKVKKTLQSYIESNGGNISMILNQKVNYYIFNGDFNELVKVDNQIQQQQQHQQLNNNNENEKKEIDLESLSYNIKKAIKLNIPIISKRYLDDSISFGSLLSPDEYSLISQYNIKEFHKSSSTTSFNYSIDNNSSTPDNQSQHQVKVERIKYDSNNNDSFPELKYHIIKHNVLINSSSDSSNSFICLELHVAGKILDLIKTGGGSSNEQSSSVYRVFLHHGTIDDSIKEWIPFNNLESTLQQYNQILSDYIVNKGYNKIQLGSMLIGSNKLQQLYNNNNSNSNSSTSNNSENSSSGINELIKILYEEAIFTLGNKFESNKLSLSPEGLIKTSFGDITLIQVDKAELILFQLSNLLRSTTSTPPVPEPVVSITSFESISLINEIFKILPQLKPKSKSNGIINYSYDLLSDIQDSIQLMKDILSVGESLSGISTNLTIDQSRYRALRCDIQNLDKSSKEFKKINDQIIGGGDNSKLIKIKNIFKINRKEEESFQFSITNNIKTLYHGSNPENILGILSRGLLTPNISTTIGSGRRDVGYLGNGIYFGVKPNTSIQYCNKSSSSSSKFMFICQVALGTIKKYSNYQIQLNQPPKGYNSVSSIPSTSLKQTDFKDEEIVIFNNKQQKLQYLIEFEDDDDDNNSGISSLPHPPLLNKPDLLISNELLKPTIKPDNVSSVIPPQQVDEEEEEEQEVGLISKNCIIPLKSVNVRAKILDLIGEVTIYQHYKNNSNSMIEAKYVFPLDEMGVVCGFEAFINGKHIIGECKEKEKAHKEYRDAIEAGHGAYLMDEDKPDFFTVSVGNLPPNCDVLIKITYVTELSIDALDISFIIPRSITPKQRLLLNQNQTQNIIKSIQATDVDKHQDNLSIIVGIEMPYNIVKLTSPTHSIRCKRTHTKATIELLQQQAGDGRLVKNFQLLIGLEEPYSPRMWVEVDDKGHHASMLAFYPKLEIDSSRDSFTNVTLLIDLSCSMAGDTFEDLLRTVRITLSNLRGIPKLLFDIVCFGDTFDWLFGIGVEASEVNLQIAWNHINRLKTSYGGTLLHQPLQSIYLLSENAKSNNPHNILLFSDGNVANEELVQMLVKKASPYCRLFAFGIGEHCSRHFIKSICRLGSGYSEFIQSNKRPNPKKIIDQLKRITQPAMSNINVVFDGTGTGTGTSGSGTNGIIQSPSTISSIFKKERQVIYAFSGICTRATLVCQAPGGGLITNSVHTPEIGFIRGNLIHRLAARSMIRDYQDGTFSDNKHQHDLIKLKKKSDIIDLSIKYSIITPFTSFIAIEKRDTNESSSSSSSSSFNNNLSTSSSLQIETIISSQSTVDSLPYINWEEKEKGIDQNLNDETLLSKRDQLSTLINQYHNSNKFSDSINIFHTITDDYGQYSNNELSLLSTTINQLINKKVNQFNNIQQTSSSSSTPSKLNREKKKLKDEIIYDCKSLLRLLDTNISIAKNNGGGELLLPTLLENQCTIYKSLIICDGDNNKYSKKQWFEKYESTLINAFEISKSLNLSSTHPTLLKLVLKISKHYKEIGNLNKSIETLNVAFEKAMIDFDNFTEDTFNESTLLIQEIYDETLNFKKDEKEKSINIINDHQEQHQQQESSEPIIEPTISINQWSKTSNNSNIINKTPIKSKPIIFNQTEYNKINNKPPLSSTDGDEINIEFSSWNIDSPVNELPNLDKVPEILYDESIVVPKFITIPLDRKTNKRMSSPSAVHRKVFGSSVVEEDEKVKDVYDEILESKKESAPPSPPPPPPMQIPPSPITGKAGYSYKVEQSVPLPPRPSIQPSPTTISGGPGTGLVCPSFQTMKLQLTQQMEIDSESQRKPIFTDKKQSPFVKFGSKLKSGGSESLSRSSSSSSSASFSSQLSPLPPPPPPPPPASSEKSNSSTSSADLNSLLSSIKNGKPILNRTDKMVKKELSSDNSLDKLINSLSRRRMSIRAIENEIDNQDNDDDVWGCDDDDLMIFEDHLPQQNSNNQIHISRGKLVSYDPKKSEKEEECSDEEDGGLLDLFNDLPAEAITTLTTALSSTPTHFRKDISNSSDEFLGFNLFQDDHLHQSETITNKPVASRKLNEGDKLISRNTTLPARRSIASDCRMYDSPLKDDNDLYYSDTKQSSSSSSSSWYLQDEKPKQEKEKPLFNFQFRNEPLHIQNQLISILNSQIVSIKIISEVLGIKESMLKNCESQFSDSTLFESFLFYLIKIFALVLNSLPPNSTILEKTSTLSIKSFPPSCKIYKYTIKDLIIGSSKSYLLDINKLNTIQF